MNNTFSQNLPFLKEHSDKSIWKNIFFALNNQIGFFGKRLKLGLSFFLPDWIFHRKDCYFRFRLSVLFYGCDSILRYDLADLKNIAQTFTQLASFFTPPQKINSVTSHTWHRAAFCPKVHEDQKTFYNFIFVDQQKMAKRGLAFFSSGCWILFFLSLYFSLAPTHTRALSCSLSFVFSLS